VDSPTYFQFAKGGGFGLGVMGEAGTEAVVPLARGPGGQLGVSAFGGSDGGGMGAAPAVYVIIQNNTGAEVQEKQSTDSDGNQIRTIIIGTVKAAISDGGMDSTFSSRFGMKSRGV
jgi:phage-related minor tail protein